MACSVLHGNQVLLLGGNSKSHLFLQCPFLQFPLGGKSLNYYLEPGITEDDFSFSPQCQYDKRPKVFVSNQPQFLWGTYSSQPRSSDTPTSSAWGAQAPFLLKRVNAEPNADRYPGNGHAKKLSKSEAVTEVKVAFHHILHIHCLTRFISQNNSPAF